MFRFNVWELLIIFGGFVLMFGAGRLPKLGSAVGEAIKNFKKGLDEDGRESTTEALDKVASHDHAQPLKEQK